MSTQQSTDDDLGDEMRETYSDCPEYSDLKPECNGVPGRTQIQSGDVASMIKYIQDDLAKRLDHK